LGLKADAFPKLPVCLLVMSVSVMRRFYLAGLELGFGEFRDDFLDAPKS